MDTGRLSTIDDFITTNYLNTKRYPGYSLLVSRNGEIAHRWSEGYDDDSIFRIYSMSKPITSIALMQLYEQGLFQLNDPVHRFIPSWRDLEVWVDGTPANHHTTPPVRPMEVRDLLTHTSGLTYSWMQRHPVDAIYRRRGIGGGGDTLEQMCDKLADVPLVFSPGTKWSYSVATDVCGRLVEIISGKRFDDYLTDNILGPLGMVDTSFWVDDDKADRFTDCYTLPALSPFGVPEGASGDDMIRIDGTSAQSPYRSAPAFLSGGGGLTSTIADYHRFCSALLNGGELDGNRIIGPRTLAYATQNHLPTGDDLASMGVPTFSESNYEGIGFGLGFSVVLDTSRAAVIGSPGAFAWGGAASTLFWIDPAEQLIVIGMTQLMPSSAYPIRDELKPLVYGAIVD
jgi:CubicO group peptidase (beta-lactamase class C family)